jgi:hypothetical protein
VRQALRRLRVQDLQLAESFGNSSPEAFAALLTPCLTSLKSSFTFPLTPATILSRFPARQPLQSLDITCSCQGPADAGDALALLPVHVPGLTRLALRSPSAGSFYSSVLGGPLQVPPAPVRSLTELSNLQQLHVSGGALVAAIASSLPLLPALTRLELPDLMPGGQASVLVALTGLKSLHLGHPHPQSRLSGAAALAAAALAAVRQMSALTELVLEQDTRSWGSRSPLGALLPVPGMLRRLVVADESIVEEAAGLLGGVIDEICSAGQCAI